MANFGHYVATYGGFKIYARMGWFDIYSDVEPGGKDYGVCWRSEPSQSLARRWIDGYNNKEG